MAIAAVIALACAVNVGLPVTAANEETEERAAVACVAAAVDWVEAAAAVVAALEAS